MQKWLFIICVFLFACKKIDNKIPIINQNQKPLIISINDVDVITNAATLRFNINYFYNDSDRIDSVKIANDVYSFDYTELTNNYKVLLKNNNVQFSNDIIKYENAYYNLIEHQRIFNVNDTSKSFFQYDSVNRIKQFDYTYNNSLQDFFITQTYKRDTVFVHTEFLNAACISNDTIKNTSYDMSKNLPYLLLTKTFNSCGEILRQDILSALPLSSYTNKLPSKIISNNNQVDYTYTFDNNDRLTQADIVTKNRATNLSIAKVSITISY